MKFYQFSILNNLNKLKQDLKLHQVNIERKNLEAVLYSYADQLYLFNSELEYKINKTQDPKTFNFHAQKVIPEWKSTWDTSLIQIVWGVIDGTFTVFVYEPDISNLERINEMTEFLPDSL